MSIIINSTTLDNHIYWRNEHEYSRDINEVTRSVWGVPILYRNRKPEAYIGELIILESDDDSGWQKISTAKELKAYSESVASHAGFVFEYYGSSYQCLFYSEDDMPAVVYVPVSRNAVGNDHWCKLSVRMIVTSCSC